jgi:hypothetical protein
VLPSGYIHTSQTGCNIENGITGKSITQLALRKLVTALKKTFSLKAISPQSKLSNWNYISWLFPESKFCKHIFYFFNILIWEIWIETQKQSPIKVRFIVMKQLWFKHIHLSSIFLLQLILITFEFASWNQPVLVSYLFHMKKHGLDLIRTRTHDPWVERQTPSPQGNRSS